MFCCLDAAKAEGCHSQLPRGRREGAPPRGAPVHLAVNCLPVFGKQASADICSSATFSGRRSADEALDGPMMSVYSRSLAKWDALTDAEKYGPVVAVVGALPAICGPQLPFLNGQQLQRDLLGLGQMSAWVVYCRDEGRGGRVLLGPQVRHFPACSCVPVFLCNHRR
jgi:hypothetical protein